jgi:high-affinity Fe2+/Pb2+ permease
VKKTSGAVGIRADRQELVIGVASIFVGLVLAIVAAAVVFRSASNIDLRLNFFMTLAFYPAITMLTSLAFLRRDTRRRLRKALEVSEKELESGPQLTGCDGPRALGSWLP